MNAKDATEVMGALQDKPLPSELKDSYMAWDLDCEFKMEDVWAKVDKYFFSHLIGWIFHTLYIKDWYMCWAWSLMTEVLEHTFHPWMLIFRECWYDQIVVDVLFTNFPGMIIGFSIMYLFNVQSYDWLGRKGKNSIKEWDVWQNHYRFNACILFLYFQTVQFVTTFFLPNALRMIVTSNIAFPRLFIWASIGVLAYKENYLFACQDPTKSIVVQGEFRWIAFTMLFLETMIVAKFYNNSVFVPTKVDFPYMLMGGWALFYGSAICYWVYLRYVWKWEIVRSQRIRIKVE